ncbi:MAG TPA: glycosyltransferase family 39 protein [Vicinamibacterales bacterium]|nr:glycosyltransferase family 39 protein [Vicinamibacterales bacterium]
MSHLVSGATFTRSRTSLLAMVVLVGLAASARGCALDYGGFSQDETNKLTAVRAYARGDWSANAEHPMLMKLAMAASLAGARAWNERGPDGRPAIAPEAALRLPNALAGAATVVPMFLLVRSFFGPAAGLLAALLLAFNVNATGISRIGKEDAFLVLFLLLGAWCYEEARARHLRTGKPAHRWYAASGAAFGLMMASKYMPYYLGLWALFGLADKATRARRAALRPDIGSQPGTRPVDQRASKWFLLAMSAAFVVANPAILLPETWRYLLGYVSGATITHHGAFFAGRVYLNTIDATPWGLPWHFYLVYLVTKTPLPVLGAIALGLAELVRRRHDRGAVFARVFLVLFLLPASLAASKFARYLLPTLAVLDIVAALGLLRAVELVRGGSGLPGRRLAAAALVVTVLAAPVLAQIRAAPHPSLYQNAIGRKLWGPGAAFPNDELYDMGVREAVTWIAERAAPGASIASDAPGVVREYVRRAGRADIEARSLSGAGVATPPVEAWVVAQNSHLCFENLEVVEQVRRRGHADYVYRVEGTPAAEVFRLWPQASMEGGGDRAGARPAGSAPTVTVRSSR